MSLLNEIYEAKTLTVDELKIFVKLLCPFAPHLAEELWSRLGETELASLAKWPEYDEAKTVDNTVTIALSVQGKPRDTVEIPVDADEDTAFAARYAERKIRLLCKG